MPNDIGWYSKEEMLETGLPYFISSWSHEPYDFALLLTKTRCASLKMPILRSGREKPSAFYYNNAPNHKYRYIPLYDRTDAFDEVRDVEFKPYEIMGTETIEEEK